jgi:hypothetical protein
MGLEDCLEEFLQKIGGGGLQEMHGRKQRANGSKASENSSPLPKWLRRDGDDDSEGLLKGRAGSNR